MHLSLKFTLFLNKGRILSYTLIIQAAILSVLSLFPPNLRGGNGGYGLIGASLSSLLYCGYGMRDSLHLGIMLTLFLPPSNAWDQEFGCLGPPLFSTLANVRVGVWDMGQLLQMTK